MATKKLFNITVYETKHFEVNQDWEIAIPGFFIIAPKQKAKSIMDFRDKEAHELIDIIRKVRLAMKKILKINEVYIFQGEKTKFGFHVWMLPRYKWMDNIGMGIVSLAPIWKYAKNNMTSEKHIKAVEKAATKVKKYLNTHPPD